MFHKRFYKARMRNWLSKVSPVTPNTNWSFVINKFYIDNIYVAFIKFISLMIESINLML